MRKEGSKSQAIVGGRRHHRKILSLLNLFGGWRSEGPKAERELYLGIAACALADKTLSKSLFFLTDGKKPTKYDDDNVALSDDRSIMFHYRIALWPPANWVIIAWLTRVVAYVTLYLCLPVEKTLAWIKPPPQNPVIKPLRDFNIK